MPIMPRQVEIHRHILDAPVVSRPSRRRSCASFVALAANFIDRRRRNRGDSPLLNSVPATGRRPLIEAVAHGDLADPRIRKR